MRLYILGNGFDLHHDIESSYFHFQKYLQVKDQHVHYIANEYLFEGSVDLWSDFENTLSKVDPNYIYNIEASEHLDWESEDFSGRDIDRLMDTARYNLETLKDGFDNYFSEWIQQIKIPSKEEVEREMLIPLIKNAKFLTFNYTDTLERVYNINPLSILHIHNDAARPIYGHGSNNMPEYVGDDKWIPTYEVEECCQNFFSRTTKDVTGIIAEHGQFWDSSNEFCEIHIIGHSLNDIDMPYMESIKDSVDSNVEWIVTYHKDEEKELFRKKLNSLGINACHISIMTTDEYIERQERDLGQLKLF